MRDGLGAGGSPVTVTVAFAVSRHGGDGDARALAAVPEMTTSVLMKPFTGARETTSEVDRPRRSWDRSTAASIDGDAGCGLAGGSRVGYPNPGIALDAHREGAVEPVDGQAPGWLRACRRLSVAERW